VLGSQAEGAHGLAFADAAGRFGEEGADLGKGRSCPGGAGLVFGFLRAVFMQQAKS
jgi:hypothetical protein